MAHIVLVHFHFLLNLPEYRYTRLRGIFETRLRDRTAPSVTVPGHLWKQHDNPRGYPHIQDLFPAKTTTGFFWRVLPSGAGSPAHGQVPRGAHTVPV